MLRRLLLAKPLVGPLQAGFAAKEKKAGGAPKPDKKAKGKGKKGGGGGGRPAPAAPTGPSPLMEKQMLIPMKRKKPANSVEAMISTLEHMRDRTDQLDREMPQRTYLDVIHEEKKKTYVFNASTKYYDPMSNNGMEPITDEAKFHCEMPSVYPLKRVPMPELFRYERPPNYMEDWLRRDAYLGLTTPPYTIEDAPTKERLKSLKKELDLKGRPQLEHIDDEMKKQEQIRGLGFVQPPKKEYPEYDRLVSELASSLTKLKKDDLVNLALSLSLEVECTEKSLWRAIEKEILSRYQIFTLEDLWKIRCALGKLRPCHVTPVLKHKIYERTLESVKSAGSFLDIMRPLQAFRGTEKRTLHNKARSVLIERRDEFFTPEVAKKKPEVIANMVYNFGTTMPRHWGIFQEDHRREVNELLSHYESHILEAIPGMNGHELVKFLEGMHALRTMEFPNIYDELERRLSAVRDQLDAHELSDVMRGLSRADDDCVLGYDKTFDQLLPLLKSRQGEMTHLEFSRCAYAYAVRRQGTPAFFSEIEKRLFADIPKMDYASLYNVAYYLLMREIKDADVWKTFAQRTIDVPTVLPLIYYQPFKLCRMHLIDAFPQWDIKVFSEKLWWAERMKIAAVMEGKFYMRQEYGDFLRMLSTFKLATTVFYTYENTFLVHYAFPRLKVGIRLYLDNELVPGTMRIAENKLVPSRLLRQRQWQIMDISYRHFIEMGKNPAMKYLENWLSTAADLQAAKDLIPPKPRYY